MSFNMESVEQAIHDANKLCDTLGLEGNIRHDFFVGLMSTMCDASFDLGFKEGSDKMAAKAVLDLHRREQELAERERKNALSGTHVFNEGHVAGRTREAASIAELIQSKSWRGPNIVDQILRALDVHSAKIGGPGDKVKYPGVKKEE